MIKINLLPEGEKEKIRNLRMAGIIIKAGSVALFSIAIFLVFLWFCYGFVSFQKNDFEKNIQNFKKSEEFKQTQESRGILEKLSSGADLIRKNNKNSIYFFEIFKKLNEITPDGILFTSLEVNKETISIKGIAKNREELLNFKNSLEQNDAFGKVDSPISNFVSSQNLEFQFSIENKNN